ncbi:uncharacterized protein [Littorina saxatilis]|uniref:uncharacterized protein n=1 Tax=Littorina saxatilis TaxID=31220 RepID=UPI0038B65824
MFGPMRGMKEQVYLGDEVTDPEITLPNVLLTDLNAQRPNPVNFTNRPPDVTHYLGVGILSNDNSYYNHPEYYPIHSLRPQNKHSSSIVNYITFALPSVPLLSQPEDVGTSIFCNRSTFKNLTQCQEKLCRCTHRIHVQLGQEVELVVAVVSPYGAGHPMHLHGYKFHVLAMEPYGPPYDIEHVEKQDKESPFVRKFFKPPFKDTVIIPNHHYAVLRFKADNPGVWFFHCHIASHMIAGQGLVIQVGDPSQWPPLPANFPRCGGHGVAYPAPGERKPCTGTASSHSSIGAAILLSLICLCSLDLKMN